MCVCVINDKVFTNPVHIRYTSELQQPLIMGLSVSAIAGPGNLCCRLRNPSTEGLVVLSMLS